MGFFSKFYIKNHLKFFHGCLLILLLFGNEGLAQRPPYSLQSAVDELHRREAAKYPLNAPPSPSQHFFGALGPSSDLDYWDDVADSNYPANTNFNSKFQNRHRYNKALAKLLERENYEADRGGLSLGPFGGYEFDDEDNNGNLFLPGDKKRSSYFRERDGKYDGPPVSPFRERDLPSSGGSELTEEFLREIEEAQERERDQHYKETLGNWGNELFQEKKRMRMPPYYMLMQKKRSYPILPYLPYDDDRKKRFPISKRLTKRSSSDIKLEAQDRQILRELYDKGFEKKKSIGLDCQTEKCREMIAAGHKDDHNQSKHPENSHQEVSKKNETPKASENPEASKAPAKLVATENSNKSAHSKTSAHGPAGLHEQSPQEHKHRKRSNHAHSQEVNSHEEESEEHEEDDEDEVDHEDEHEHEGEHEEAEDEEEDDEEKKKKRDVSLAKAKKDSQLNPIDLAKARKKKSIQWSKYFGIDRKKKAQNLDVKKRSAYEEDFDLDEILKKRQDLDPEKLDNMDKKLQFLEDYIIDDTIKYTGAHEGVNSPAGIRSLKDHVLSRLTTAYNLEKMRRALERLRQNGESNDLLLRNIIDVSDSDNPKNQKLDNYKRLSVKKESLPANEGPSDLSPEPEQPKETHSNTMMMAPTSHKTKTVKVSDENDDNDDDKKKKQKKRTSYMRYPSVSNDLSDFQEDLVPGNYESLNDAYLGTKNYIVGSNQCPVIENLAERCQSVDLLSGDLNQELLSACGVHQICYLCGTSQIACDYQFLNEADAICGNNNECQAAARSVLMILRGTPGTQLGPRECLKNPCLYSAMREIGL